MEIGLKYYLHTEPMDAVLQKNMEAASGFDLPDFDIEGHAGRPGEGQIVPYPVPIDESTSSLPLSRVTTASRAALVSMRFSFD